MPHIDFFTHKPIYYTLFFHKRKEVPEICCNLKFKFKIDVKNGMCYIVHNTDL